jgi:hypothetical protein
LFLQDNAAPHKAVIMRQKFAGLHSEVLKHLTYSPELAPSDYCLFSTLKKHLKGRKFFINEQTSLAADRRFAAQTK